MFRKVFAEAGYSVAVIARNADHVNKTVGDVRAAGGDVCHSQAPHYSRSLCLQAAPFPVQAYDAASLTSAFSAIHQTWPSSTHTVRVAVFNAAFGIWKPFLEITDEEVAEALDTNVRAAFAFSRLAISLFKDNALDEVGKRGALIFTGATASWRGNKTTSAFAAGKFGLRALSQSLNKEFGRDNIHVTILALLYRAIPYSQKLL